MSKKSSKGAASSKHSDPFDRMPNESAKAYSRSKANQAKHAGLIVRRINLADAAPHPDNPRNHPAKGTPEWEALRQSLLSDYFDPMVLNSRNGLLVSGHYRRKILLDEGFHSADMVVVDWDEPTHKARMIAANELLGRFDDAKLSAFLEEIKAGALAQAESGLTDERLAELLASCTIPQNNQAIDETALAETNMECPKCGFKWEKA